MPYMNQSLYSFPIEHLKVQLNNNRTFLIKRKTQRANTEITTPSRYFSELQRELENHREKTRNGTKEYFRRMKQLVSFHRHIVLIITSKALTAAWCRMLLNATQLQHSTLYANTPLKHTTRPSVPYFLLCQQVFNCKSPPSPTTNRIFWYFFFISSHKGEISFPLPSCHQVSWVSKSQGRVHSWKSGGFGYEYYSTFTMA